MTAKMYWLIFDVPKDLEEKAIDALLALETPAGFDSFPIDYRHYRPTGLTLSEQVAGRQKKIRFQVEIRSDNASESLAHLRRQFGNNAIAYRMLPIAESDFL